MMKDKAIGSVLLIIVLENNTFCFPQCTSGTNQLNY